MKEYVSLFMEYMRYERNYSVHTVTSYANDLACFVDFLADKEAADGAVFDVDRIDADIVREWLMILMKGSLSATSVNRKLSALQSFFTFAVRKGFVQKHPLRSVKGPKKPQKIPYFIKEREMVNLLDEIPENQHDSGGSFFEGVRNQLMLELFYETGIRCAELVGIRDVDVDMEAMLLKVTGKRNKQRLIPFADRLKDMIVQYNNVRAREVGANCPAFFVRKDGRPVSSAIVYYAIRKKLSQIPALAKQSPHVLRHSFATSMLNDGAEIGAVGQLLGHSSLASTSVYTHVTFEELKKVYNAHPRAK